MELLLQKDYVGLPKQPYKRPLLFHLLNIDTFPKWHAEAQAKLTWKFKDKILARIPHSKDDVITAYGDCFDCGTGDGELHLLGCLIELCPNCSSRFMICKCHTCDLDPQFDCRNHTRNPNRTLFFLKELLEAHHLSTHDNRFKVPRFLQESRD